MRESVLVLGAGGFIGRALVHALSTAGESVIAVARDAGAMPRHTLVESVIGELATDEDVLTLIARSRAVVHLATTSTPGTSAALPLNEIDTNLRFTAILLQALQARPATPLLYLSSGGSLYAGATAPSIETSQVRPRSYHGAAKLASECFIDAWCQQFDGASTILRPSNVYGPGQPERAGFGIVPAAIGALLRDEPLIIWGDGTVRRDYIYIDDLVSLCLRILERPMPPGARIFNACSGESTPLQDMLRDLEAIAGRPLKRDYKASSSVHAADIAMDASRAAEAYGWHCSIVLAEGLRRTWDATRKRVR